MAQAGDTILIPSGPKSHLFFVLNNVCPAGRQLIVNISTIQQGVAMDQTCEVKAGEHPFVWSDSVIMYGLAQVVQAAALDQNVENGTYPTRPAASPALLQRIIAGVTASGFTPHRIKTYWRGVTGGGVQVIVKRKIKKPGQPA